jgi:hypothetical protein
MHKSALTFGLLASSLVMLVIMPFLNQNNSFFNVMAQEYEKYGDSSYSQYPTDDKKYECRTGPFEGFFVSSVEFCKHVKFDDRKDHSIDNKTGAQGPQGPQGPQGQPGITQLNDTNTYSVTSGEIVNTFNSSTVGVASCNSGDFVINGGFTITGTSPSPAGVTLFEDWNKPFYTPVTSGWEVFIFPTTSSGKVIYLVHATCFDNSP